MQCTPAEKTKGKRANAFPSVVKPHMSGCHFEAAFLGGFFIYGATIPFTGQLADVNTRQGVRMDEEQTYEAATKQLERVIAFAARIDGRAPVILGTVLAMIAVLAVNLPRGAVGFQWFLALPLLGYGIAVCVALWQLYKCFYPELEGGHNSLVYFREAAKLTESEYVRRFQTQPLGEHNTDLLQQAWRIAQVDLAKYESLKTAMVGFAFSIAFWLVVLGVFVWENKGLLRP